MWLQAVKEPQAAPNSGGDGADGAGMAKDQLALAAEALMHQLRALGGSWALPHLAELDAYEL